MEIGLLTAMTVCNLDRNQLVGRFHHVHPFRLVNKSLPRSLFAWFSTNRGTTGSRWRYALSLCCHVQSILVCRCKAIRALIHHHPLALSNNASIEPLRWQCLCSNAMSFIK